MLSLLGNLHDVEQCLVIVARHAGILKAPVGERFLPIPVQPYQRIIGDDDNNRDAYKPSRSDLRTTVAE
jgi:hypothetical protein